MLDLDHDKGAMSGSYCSFYVQDTGWRVKAPLCSHCMGALSALAQPQSRSLVDSLWEWDTGSSQGKCQALWCAAGSESEKLRALCFASHWMSSEAQHIQEERAERLQCGRDTLRRHPKNVGCLLLAHQFPIVRGPRSEMFSECGVGWASREDQS